MHMVRGRLQRGHPGHEPRPEPRWSPVLSPDSSLGPASRAPAGPRLEPQPQPLLSPTAQNLAFFKVFLIHLCKIFGRGAQTSLNRRSGWGSTVALDAGAHVGLESGLRSSGLKRDGAHVQDAVEGRCTWRDVLSRAALKP